MTSNRESQVRIISTRPGALGESPVSVPRCAAQRQVCIYVVSQVKINFCETAYMHTVSRKGLSHNRVWPRLLPQQLPLHLEFVIFYGWIAQAWNFEFLLPTCTFFVETLYLLVLLPHSVYTTWDTLDLTINIRRRLYFTELFDFMNIKGLFSLVVLASFLMLSCHIILLTKCKHFQIREYL